MRKITAPIIIASIFSCLSIGMEAIGEESSSESRNIQNTFEAFTGKITREKVRLRLQPNLESPVVKELNKNDLLIVTGEQDEFYIVQPPISIKGYVYRPYVLDGIVEGERVNVRLGPHLEAPVIAQLNSGDRIEGNQSLQNNKWLEIAPPTWTRFYVATDYVEKVGDANYLSTQENRLQEIVTLLNNTYFLSQNELQKPFPEINTDKILANYRHVIDAYKDFPEQVTRAKEAIVKFQDEYLHKKIAYLETKTKASGLEREQVLQTTKEKLAQQETANEAFQDSNEPLSPIEQYDKWIANRASYEVNSKMMAWTPAELEYYQNWAADNGQKSIQDFYEDQKKSAVALKGIIEVYDRPLRNKPGDFLLVNKSNRLPIAYLYSTHVNLQDKVGQEVVLEGSLRPNKNFAYPAYFVISLE